MQVFKHGKRYLVPKKFTPSGQVITSKHHSSKRVAFLTQNDLQFLVLWRENKWDEEKTAKKCGLPKDQAERTFRKLAYFKAEDARIRALAQEACPERIIAKDMENVETGKLNDSQHKSLDRMAKVIGAFKTTEVNIQQNVFNMPKISPETERALKAIAERELSIQEVDVA